MVGLNLPAIDVVSRTFQRLYCESVLDIEKEVMVTILLTAFGGLIIGLLVGYLLGGRNKGGRPREKRLQLQIDELRNEYTRYQAEVNEYFMESARLLRRLNDVQRDMQQHVANNADKLTKDEDFQQLLRGGDTHPRLDHESDREPPFEPPRDYAPKDNPNAEGTLSEAYGLESEKREKTSN